MALFNDITNETEAKESVFVGFTGGLLASLLCVPSIIRSVSAFITYHDDGFLQDSSMALRVKSALFPNLPELIIFVAFILLAFALKSKQYLWAGVGLIGLVIIRMYWVHGIDQKPYTFGLLLGFFAIVLMLEGLHGARAHKRIIANPSPEDTKQNPEKFNYDEHDLTHRIDRVSFGGYMLAAFAFTTLFLYVFSEFRPKFILHNSLALYLGLVFLQAFLFLSYAVLSWKVGTKKSLKSAIVLLLLFLVNIATSFYLSRNTSEQNFVTYTILAVIFVLLVMSVHTTWQYKKQFGASVKPKQ